MYTNARLTENNANEKKWREKNINDWETEENGGAVSIFSRYTRIYIRIVYLHCEMSIRKCVLENEIFRILCGFFFCLQFLLHGALLLLLSVVDSSFSFLVNARFLDDYRYK